jgi:carboxyl-terminal processing protease
MARLVSIPAVALLLLARSAGHDEGTWRVDYREGDGTELAIRLTLRVDGDHWVLNSRPGGVNAFLNWRQRVLGRLAGKLPPNGALMTGSGNAIIVGDSILLRGTLESQFTPRRHFAGVLHNDRLRADLALPNDTNRIVSRMEGVPWSSTAPLRNYPGIAARTRDSIQALVYDPAIADAPNMSRFLDRFSAASSRAMDDLDMMAAFASAQPLIGISHFGFVRNPRVADTPLDSLVAGDRTVDVSKLVNLTLYGGGAVAYLRVQSWDRATPYIQRAFERIDSARTSVLVLDLTGNPGGDATSLTPATHLFTDTIQGGMVVGRAWYASHRSLPSADDLVKLPVLADEEQAKSLLKIVATVGAAQFRFAPRPPHFGGKVYVLVDGRTGSASEPLVYALKKTGRATLVGQRTGGAVLVALPHPVGEGFVVRVPESDYYVDGHVRLEGNGVEADLVAADPHVAADEEIRKTMPYAALEMLGQLWFNRRQFDAAERYWTEARAYAPSDAARQVLDRRIAAAQKARTTR